MRVVNADSLIRFLESRVDPEILKIIDRFVPSGTIEPFSCARIYDIDREKVEKMGTDNIVSELKKEMAIDLAEHLLEAGLIDFEIRTTEDLSRCAMKTEVSARLKVFKPETKVNLKRVTLEDIHQ